MDKMGIMADPEKRAQYFAELKAKLKEIEAARVAAMTPEKRARYEDERKHEEEYRRYLEERSELTNGEIQQERTQLEYELDFVGEERDEAKRTSADATSAQGGTDRKLTEARREIAELKAKLAATEAKLGAALKARDEMLKLYADQLGK